MTNLIDQSLGRYHILKLLGEGGMATVYKAYDTHLEREVAIKIIRTELFGSAFIERVLQRFIREAKSLAKLSHPNIVVVHDYGEYENAPYLVMQYLPGGTLKKRLGKPIPWREAIQLLLPIGKALVYAHQRGVIHRDVKPSNILLTENSVPVLSDFGIAKMLEFDDGQTLTATGTGVGTPEYMAPEQGLGKDVDARADIYALGVVFYELLTGQKPFTAETPMEVIFKHKTEPLPMPRQIVREIPEAVENILVRALAKKPEDRYKDMNSFVAAMETIERINDFADERSRRREEDQTRLATEKKTRKISNLQFEAKIALDKERWKKVEQISLKLSRLGEDGQKEAINLSERLAQAKNEAENLLRQRAEEQARLENEKKKNEISRLFNLGTQALQNQSWKDADRICKKLEQLGEEGKIKAANLHELLISARRKPETSTVEMLDDSTSRKQQSKSSLDSPEGKKRNHFIRLWGIGLVLLALLIILINAPLSNQILSSFQPTSTYTITPTITVIPPTKTEMMPTQTRIPTITPPSPEKTEIIDTKGISMRLVFAGDFFMGIDRSLQHIYLDSFYIDKYEVTNASYKQCVDDGSCQPPEINVIDDILKYYDTLRFANYPVAYINWYMARDYCGWRGAKLLPRPNGRKQHEAPIYVYIRGVMNSIARILISILLWDIILLSRVVRINLIPGL